VKAVRIVVALVLLAILVGLVAFAVQNPGQRVDVRVGQTIHRDVPLVIALFMSFLVGIALTMIFGLYFLIEQSMESRRLRREKRTLARELDALRNLSIEEGPHPEPAGATAGFAGERDSRREIDL
jgi:uncharacterized integral membrane protein